MQTAAAEGETRAGAAPLLGPWMSLGLVVGSMLGIGIFIAPPQVAALVPHTGWILAAWVAGGVFALCGALSVAEPATMLPRSGGDYVYLRAAFGPSIAFAVGWLQILAIFPGSIAALACALAQYQLPVLFGDFLPAELSVGRWAIPTYFVVAPILVLVLTAFNQFRLTISGGFQMVMAGVPVLVLFAVAISVLLNSPPAAAAADAATPVAASLSVTALMAAYLPIYFAYSGWNAPIYIGGEVKEPGRNLPIALWGGTALVTILYCMLCAGFLTVLSVDGLAESGEAGSQVAAALFGRSGVVLITLLILFAILGSINGTIMTGARIPQAMATEGEFPGSGENLHPRHRSPIFALWFQAAICAVLIFTRQIDQILTYTASAMLISGTLTVLAVVALRRRMPDRARPFRTPLYPLPPVLYVASSLLVLGVMIYERDSSVLLAVAWFLCALLIRRRFLEVRESARARITFTEEG